MDKIYFLWLQKIANINSKLNVKSYEEKILKYKEYILQIFNGDFSNLNKIKDVDKSILNDLLNKNIKEEVNYIYEIILRNNYYIITIEDKEYPRKLTGNIPFCYITNSKINLNNKNVYIYYDTYFTKYARHLISYFGKIVTEEKANLITEYENNELDKISIISEDFFKNINRYDCNKINIILPNDSYLKYFKINILDYVVIIEAKYEEKIVGLVDEMVELGKEVLVVPSNIYNENSFFSNYLIKQGADIILNKRDLKFVLKRLTC